jgi:enamine deaminase RidA (YjgF/YER057c/UK114 family)
MKEAYAKYGASVSRRAGRFLYIGGLVSFKDDGSVLAPGDGKRQVEVIYARLGKILAMHGATFANVIRENHFVTDWDEFVKGAPARIRAYDAAGAEYPATTAVQVNSLAEEGLIAEVDFVVFLAD